MDYYHGATVGGLTELRPFASANNNIKEPTVYLTTSKQLAAHYIWDYSHVIRGIQRGDWLGDTSSPEYQFHQAKWPQYLREAEVLREHGLL